MRESRQARINREAQNLAQIDPYKRLFTAPMWNTYVTICDVPRLLRHQFEFVGWGKAEHVARAIGYAKLAIECNNALSRLIAIGTRVFDGHGPLISGVYHNHWPDSYKDFMRRVSHLSTDYRNKSRAHWSAAGRTSATWRAMMRKEGQS